MISSDPVTAALRPLAKLLLPLLREELAAEQAAAPEPDTWVDQTSSPLGRRAHCRACKAGEIEGAHKLGKRWLARRSAVDSYVVKYGIVPGTAGEPEEEPAADPDEPTEAEVMAFVRALGQDPLVRPGSVPARRRRHRSAKAV